MASGRGNKLALDRLYDGMAQMAQDFIKTPKPPLKNIVAKLINGLNKTGADFILVLDDYHLIEEPSLHESSMLHQRASAWFEQQGLIVEAADHALAADDFQRAARLIDQIALTMLASIEVTKLRGWLEILPESLVLSKPWLCLAETESEYYMENGAFFSNYNECLMWLNDPNQRVRPDLQREPNLDECLAWLKE